MSLRGKGNGLFWLGGGKASLWLDRGLTAGRGMTTGREMTLGRVGAENFQWVEGNSLGEGQEPFFVEGGDKVKFCGKEGGLTPIPH